MVKPANIEGYTLFLRSYIYLNENWLFLSMCVLLVVTYSLLDHPHVILTWEIEVLYCM